MNTRVVQNLLVAIADEAWPSLTTRCQMQGHQGSVKALLQTASRQFRISYRSTMAQQEHPLLRWRHLIDPPIHLIDPRPFVIEAHFYLIEPLIDSIEIHR